MTPTQVDYGVSPHTRFTSSRRLRALVDDAGCLVQGKAKARYSPGLRRRREIHRSGLSQSNLLIRANQAGRGETYVRECPKGCRQPMGSRSARPQDGTRKISVNRKTSRRLPLCSKSRNHYLIMTYDRAILMECAPVAIATSERVRALVTATA